MSGELINMGELAGHVADGAEYHLPRFMGRLPELPTICGVQITRFMVVELVVAILMIAIFVPLAAKIKSGRPTRGRFWNLLEVVLLYLRDEVMTPAIGKKDVARFAPFLWTLFFFILFCNLAGLIPWFGASPTGALATTAVLAATTFVVLLAAGMKEFGVVGFWLAQVPAMDLPVALAIFLKPMIFVIEIIGLCVKHVVLAVRLLANMFAGHLVLAVLLGFIAGTADCWALWLGVTVASVAMCVALNLLELFVAFLQAYIFMFLVSIFIGMARSRH